MMQRLDFLWPEIMLFAGTCVVMVLGLSRTLKARRASAVVAGLSLIAAGYLAWVSTPVPGSSATCPLTGLVFSGPLKAEAGQLLLPQLAPYAKVLIAAVGLLLLLVAAGTVDRAEERAIEQGRRTFDPLRSNRAEFYAFFLFSLTGLMLCASADDLVWLFLALELTSLPTYIMVTISTPHNRSREAGVKYFFLGALGAAIFLYGFALIYGGTGSTNLNQIALTIRQGGLGPITLAGMLLAMLGLCFKIAAVPMHFYTPDVYEGAAPQVSAFLAFVPKTAGFLGMMLLASAVGWGYGADSAGLATLLSTKAAAPAMFTPEGTHLPEVLRLTLWVVAALTMTVGNVLAVLQTRVKRMLAYSSIAHSGYMLVGLIAGPGDGSFTRSGLAAILFYLTAYGVMNTGAFAAIAACERAPDADGNPREIESLNDLRGLCVSHPLIGWSLVICSLSLLGLPPLLGFFGKLPLFTSGIAAGEIPLVIVLGVNSAIGAFYYLRLAFFPFLEQAEEGAEPVIASPFRSRKLAAGVSAAGVIVLALLGSSIIRLCVQAASTSPKTTVAHRDQPASESGEQTTAE